jgi:hypothetical protein
MNELVRFSVITTIAFNYNLVDNVNVMGWAMYKKYGPRKVMEASYHFRNLKKTENWTEYEKAFLTFVQTPDLIFYLLQCDANLILNYALELANRNSSPMFWLNQIWMPLLSKCSTTSKIVNELIEHPS